MERLKCSSACLLDLLGGGTPSPEESDLQQGADNLPTPTSRAGPGRDIVTHELYRPTHVAVRFRAWLS
jgi:hypothetical protein